MTHRRATGRGRILVAAVVVASLAGAGCGAPGSDPSAGVPTSAAPSSAAPRTPGTATTGTAGNPGGGGPTEAPQQPPPATTPPAQPEATEPATETVWVQPIHLLAPLRCFTEGLDTRYVDGYGSLAVDPRPYGDLEFFEQEYDSLTRITMNSAQRRVILLPGRRVLASPGQWLVDIVIRMYLSGGFVVNYNATHRGETGTFTSPPFTSPVDDTCTVTITYAITTVPAA